MPTQNFFDQLLSLCEFVSTCKKLSYFIDLFWRYGWLKNPTIWLAVHILVHISRISQKFSKIWDLCRHAANNISFHYRTNSVKIMDWWNNDFLWIQETLFVVHFSSIFPILGAKKIFWKIQLSCTNSYGFLVPCQNLEKTNNTTPRKCLNRRKDGRKDERKDERKDGQTKFYRSLPATACDPKIDNSFRNCAILVESMKATSAKNAVFSV